MQSSRRLAVTLLPLYLHTNDLCRNIGHPLTLQIILVVSDNPNSSFPMDDSLTLPPEIASELAGFVRHSMTRARMHISRLARNASSLTDEQAQMLDDGHRLGAMIRAVVDDTISSTLNRLNSRTAYPLPEVLPSDILCQIWGHLEFRDRFAVTGVCR